MAVLWTLPARGQCPATIAPDSLAAEDTGGPVDFCVGLDFRIALRADRALDGSPLTGPAVGCDYDTLVYYPYTTFPRRGEDGPYRLLEWVVGGQTFSGDFVDVAALVALMNALDPGAGWFEDGLTDNIVGGRGGVAYGRLRVQHIGDGTTRNVTPNFQSVAGGTLVTASGPGWHSYTIFDGVTGCRDTLALLLRPNLPDERRTVVTNPVTATPQQCLPVSGFVGTPQAPTVCGAPANGTLAATSAYCYTYTPDPGHSGSDLVCFRVCDDTPAAWGGPICRTTFIDFVTRATWLITRDTARFTIRPTDTTVCLGAFLQLTDPVDQVSTCLPDGPDLAFAPLPNGCVDLDPSPGFAGEVTGCVVHCAAGRCDTTVVIVNVLAGCTFEPFAAAVDSVADGGNPTRYCVAVAPVDFDALEFTLSGRAYVGPRVGCAFEEVRLYNYAPLVGNGSAGPYTLTSWEVDGQRFNTSFFAPADLAAYMRSVDPAGDWRLNADAFAIVGGDPATTYGTMRIVHDATGTLANLLANPVDEPRGTTVDLPGPGSYDLVLRDPTTGCADSVTVVVGRPEVGTFIEIVVPVETNTTAPVTCPWTSPRDSTTVCGDVANGTATVDAAACVTYTPGRDFVGSDTLCLITCATPAGVCDTARLIFVVTPPVFAVDTIRVTSFGDAAFSACATPAFAGPYAPATFCGTSGEFDVEVNPTAGACITIDPVDAGSGDGTACVEFCAQADPTRCQRFVFVISRTGDCVPELFPADSLTVDAPAGIASICLGDGVDLSGYALTLTNGATARADSTCGTTVGGGGGGSGNQIDVYAYSTFLTPAGAKRIDGWDIDGVLVSDITAASYAALADSMSVYDPGNDWSYDPVAEALVATSDVGNYSPLILFDPGSGSSLILPLDITTVDGGGDTSTFVAGVAVDLPGPGRFEVIAMRNDSSCADRLLIYRPAATAPTRDTLEFVVAGDAVAGPFCLDNSELLSAPESIGFCGAPANGRIDFTSLTCFTYTPDPGFSGADSACVVVCTAGGLQCDTTFLRFAVTPRVTCGVIYAQDTITVETTVCDGPAEVCLPALPGDVYDYAFGLDNRALARLDACGADTVTVYSYADLAGRGAAGPYRVEGFRLPTGVFTEVVPSITGVVDALNRWDTAGAWRLSAGDFTIRGGVNGYAYDTLVIRQVATDTINRLVPVQVLTENQPLVTIAAGTYELIVGDFFTGCTDTATLVVTCAEVPGCDSILAVSALALETTDCDATVGFTVELPSEAAAAEALVRVGGSVIAAVASGRELTVQLSTGTQTVRVELAGGACAREFAVEVSCRCPGLLPADSYGRAIDCASAVHEVCLPTDAATLAGYEILVDGTTYTGPLRECGFEEANVIDLLSLGEGPFTVDSFRIGAQVFSTDVSSLATLADTVSRWDPLAVWRYDVARGALIGSASTAVYGVLAIREIGTGRAYALPVTTASLPTGVSLMLRGGAGPRVLTLDDGADCTQEIVLTLTCVTPDEIVDTMLVGDALRLCVDQRELTGPVVSLRDVCPAGDAAAALDFDTGVGCVGVRGIAVGERRACLVACDASGVCDTTYYTVRVVAPGSGGLDAVDDVFSVRRDERLFRSVTANDTFAGALSVARVVAEPARGIAVLTPDGVLSYVPTQGECGFVDSLEYEICQGPLCDRARVLIRVRCELVEAYTGFSPNGDGVNERFVIVGIEDFPENTLRVFNRWGNEVFVAESYANDWEGTWDGNELPDGTYFWLLDIDGQEPLRGWVQLNR